MISKNMIQLVSGSSLIRQMFEEGKKMEALHGKENVFDFSLGNPSIEPPIAVKNAIQSILEEESPNFVHGYMNNSGYEDVRETIAASVNKKQGTDFSANNVVMTVGAAGGINIVFKTILNPDDEVIVFTPFFAEYGNYISNFSGKMIVVPCDYRDFQPDFDAFEKAINPKTKAIIINSPNNPSGAVYSLKTIEIIVEILNKKQKEYNSEIFIVADEPYREIVYGNGEIPYLTKYYNNTFVSYSYSKSLSLPGERIGYVVVPSSMNDFGDVMISLNVANRILGFVNAPSLLQRVIKRTIDEKVDVSIYEKNRDVLYHNLTKMGYEMLKPEGTFYMFPKSLEEDDVAFCTKAKKYNLILVPGSAFGCPGHFRISYCVALKTVENSLAAFEALAKEYGK